MRALQRELLKVEIVTRPKLYPTLVTKLSHRLVKLIGGFNKCHWVCGNNNTVSFVTDLLGFYVTNEGKFHLRMNFWLSNRRGNKQAAEEKQYVFILYSNSGKHTIGIK